jgi:large subunit ribosomal protein L13
MSTTKSVKPAEIKREWLQINAEGKILGRIATEIARRLRGKHKSEYTPHEDTGDYIVVTNAAKVAVKGNNKLIDKKYYRHSGYIGGMKETNLDKMLKTKPTEVIETAVKGMMPRGPLGRKMFKKLKVYAGEEHPHTAQQPKEIEL